MIGILYISKTKEKPKSQPKPVTSTGTKQKNQCSDQSTYPDILSVITPLEWKAKRCTIVLIHYYLSAAAI